MLAGLGALAAATGLVIVDVPGLLVAARRAAGGRGRPHLDGELRPDHRDPSLRDARPRDGHRASAWSRGPTSPPYGR